MYIVFLILPLSAACLILNWIPSGSVLASWLVLFSFLLFLSLSSSSFTFFSFLLSCLSLLTSFRSSLVSSFLSLPTGADRNTGERAEESIELKGNSLPFFFLSRFHPRGITGFYLIGVHMISRGLVMRISVLCVIFSKSAPQVHTGI